MPRKTLLLILTLPLSAILLTGCLNSKEKAILNAQVDILCTGYKAKPKNKEEAIKYMRQGDSIVQKYGFSSFNDFSASWNQLSQNKVEEISNKAMEKAEKECGYKQQYESQ